MILQEMLDMELNELYTVDRTMDITRVPGGWIYTLLCGEDTNSVFVPEPKIDTKKL